MFFFLFIINIHTVCYCKNVDNFLIIQIFMLFKFIVIFAENVKIIIFVGKYLLI